jgi:hypothetical protein
MKKILFLAIVVFFVLSISGISFAAYEFYEGTVIKISGDKIMIKSNQGKVMTVVGSLKDLKVGDKVTVNNGKVAKPGMNPAVQPLYKDGEDGVNRSAVHEVCRDFTLERAALARAHRLTAFLQPEARAKLHLATRVLLAHLASGSENVDSYTLAEQEVRSKFAQLSGKQSDMLSFYVLAEVVRILQVPDKLKGELDGMNEMSEMTSLRLQMTMDRRSKFISTLSNIMKKISTTQDTLVQNIK